MAHNPARLVCGLGFDVVLGGKLQDPRRGDDLRFWRLQDRILASTACDRPRRRLARAIRCPAASRSDGIMRHQPGPGARR